MQALPGGPFTETNSPFERGKLTLTANGMLAEPKKKIQVATKSSFFFLFSLYDAGAESVWAVNAVRTLSLEHWPHRIGL